MLWQELVVREGMSTNADTAAALAAVGKPPAWAAFEVGVLVSRQNGKNGAMEVVELGWMVNEPGVSILHTAHEFQTALESMDKLEALIRSHPLLEREILSVRRGNGKESIRLKNGSVIRFRTRTKSGGRGFSVDRLVIDEAMIWSPASQAAILPLLTTAQRPQIWYLGSAADVDTHEYCQKWASLRERALAGDDDGLIWLEWSAPDPPEGERARKEWRADRSNWAASNPGLGELLTEDYIDAEIKAFRSNLDKWEIERLSVGRWPALNGDNSEIPADEWKAMRNPSPKLVGRPAIGLHCDPDTGIWAIVGAQRTDLGHSHLEYRPPLGKLGPASSHEVVRAIVDLVTALDPVAVAIKRRSDAAAIEDDLIKAGIEPEMVDGGRWSQWCGGFLNAALDSRLSHSGQSVLGDAAAAAVRKDMPAGGFVWDEDAASVSAPALFASTLAHGALIAFSEPPKRKTVPARSAAKQRPRGQNDELDAMSMAF
jgi:hypothetical protein